MVTAGNRSTLLSPCTFSLWQWTRLMGPRPGPSFGLDTSPLHDLYITSTWPLHDLYITSTWPLHNLYMTSTWPLHNLYMTSTWPLHDLYMSWTRERVQKYAFWEIPLPLQPPSIFFMHYMSCCKRTVRCIIVLIDYVISLLRQNKEREERNVFI